MPPVASNGLEVRFIPHADEEQHPGPGWEPMAFNIPNLAAVLEVGYETPQGRVAGSLYVKVS